MNIDDVKTILDSRRAGTYLSLTKIKDYGKGITKISNLVIRIGCNYSNIKVVHDRLVAENREAGPLPWGKWVEGYVNYLIENKGSYYLRVSNDYCDRNSSTYYLDGQEITKDQAISILGEKKLKSGNPDVYNIKLENILSISIR